MKERELTEISKACEVYRRVLFSKNNYPFVEIFEAEDYLNRFVLIISDGLINNEINYEQALILEKVLLGIYHYRKIKPKE